jgi:AcrR family transcriptional regulator
MTKMTPREGRVVRATRRRLQILDAARVCFRQYGFRGASMSDISAIAEMSIGHIYHYFQNKDAIIEAVVERELLRELPTGDLAAADGDLSHVLSACLETLLDGRTLANDPGLTLEILAESVRNPRVAELVRHFLGV